MEARHLGEQSSAVTTALDSDWPSHGRMTLLIFLIAACARTHVDRAEWQRMSKEEKTLYVRTLLGHEKVKEAKGGNDRTFDRPPEEYARRIDDAYARGEQRDTGAVFEELGAKR